MDVTLTILVYRQPPFPEIQEDPDLSHPPDELLRRIRSHRDAIRELEKKLSYHQKAIAQYRGRLNDLQSRINVLMPPELLREVFKQLMWGCVLENIRFLTAKYGSNIKYRPTRSTWLRVAHVCRYWRSIALTFPELFSFLDAGVYGPATPFASRCLKLSNPAPLYLSFDELKHNLKAFEQVAHRISEMRIANLQTHLSNTSPIFPAVQSLTVHIPHLSTSIDAFMSHFPNLKYLHFASKGYPTVLPCLPLPLLTHLRLCCNAISGEQFSGLFRTFPNLKVLELHVPSISEIRGNLIPPTQALTRLKLYYTSYDASTLYGSLIKFLGCMPEVLQLDVGQPEDQGWMVEVVGTYRPGVVTLVSDYGRPTLELHRRSDTSISTTNRTRISEHHIADPPRDDEFHVEDVKLFDLSAFAPHKAEIIFELYTTLSDLRVRSLHWNISTANDPSYAPFESGYVNLETLYICSKTHSKAECLRIADRVVWSLGRTSQTRLKVLHLEWSASPSRGQEGPNDGKTICECIESLTDSVGALRLMNEG